MTHHAPNPGAFLYGFYKYTVTWPHIVQPGIFARIRFPDFWDLDASFNIHSFGSFMMSQRSLKHLTWSSSPAPSTSQSCWL